MKKLFQIVLERSEKQKELSSKTAEFNKEKKRLEEEISDLARLENTAKIGLDIEQIQLAEKVIQVAGDPYGKADSNSGLIADAAILDIAKGCIKLKTEYFGNKTYSGYYQRCDCSYGMGPRHGGICDSIGLHPDYRDKELTDQEKDACIYYIKNYPAIVASKTTAF